MGKLSGKIALITDGNSGIGLESARVFIEEGARVFLTERNRETLDAGARSVGSKRWRRRPRATLHGVVFDIFGGGCGNRRDSETSCLKGICWRGLRLQRNGAPDTIRTCDLCLRRATLYPAELRVH